MNAMQRVTFQLLEEIDDICSNNGLKYFLGPVTTATAMLHNGYDRNLICPDLLMSVEDIRRLLERFNQGMASGRAIEHMGNSKNFIGFQISYVNENTTFMQLNRGTDILKCGARVNIIPIRRSTAGFGAKLLRVLETGWECNGYRFTKRINIKTIIAAGAVRLAMLIGKRNVGGLLFNRFMTQYGNPKDLVVVKEPKKKSIQLSANFFTSAETILFAGREFPIPNQSEEFLQTYFGEYWRETFANRNVNYMDTVILPSMSYHEFINITMQNGYDIKKYFNEYRMSIIKGIFLLPALRKRSKAILIAKRSGDRLRFYEEFQQKREIIHNLYSHQNYEALKQVYAEHERTTLFYLKKKLGFCICEEFFEIQCALFSHYGQNDIVERIKKLVPKEHYKPIV
jgi:phosphorylcholine metabolism protein LicD